MKRILPVIIISLVISSCNTDLKTEKKSNSQASVENSEPKTIVDNKNTYKNGSSLIGKTTIEIERLGFYNCAGTVIDSKENKDEYSISQLASSQEECSNGSGKIVLDKALSKNENEVVYKIIDEINIQSSNPEKVYNWTTCKIKEGESEKLYVVHFKDHRQAKLTEIYDVWTIDFKVGKFVKMKDLKRITCVNPDYSEEL